MRRSWTAAFALAGTYLLSGWLLTAGSGLVRTVVSNGADRTRLETRNVQNIDLDGVNPSAAGPDGVTVRWQGAWEVPASTLYDLRLASQGRSSWLIDGHLAQEAASASAANARTVWLAAGFHRLDLTCVPDSGSPRIVLSAARTGRSPEPLASGSLRRDMPAYPRLRALATLLHALFGWLTIAALGWAIRRTLAEQQEHRNRLAVRTAGQAIPQAAGSRRVCIARAFAWTALACILAHGALLRIDSITGRYGPVTSPRWLAAVQTRAFARPEAIRPAGMRWEPEPLYVHRDAPSTHYSSDPYIYLVSARQMTSFYAAHFREPVFPFATRVSLSLFRNEDVAVSFASAFFSVLAIWLTYVLGAAVWSRPAGLLAALGLSLDYDVLSHAGLGWRDDAYMAAVVLCAWLMLRCWRAAGEATRIRHWRGVTVDAAHLDAFVLGVASGLAVLTRVMAVPFLAVGGLFLIFAPGASWRRRLTITAIAAATAAVVAGPYFVNCWRVFGDPLYTFNVHGAIYNAAEGKGQWRASTAAYVLHEVAARPVDMLDTVAQGLTTYPFTNKWHGLDAWYSGLGDWVSLAAIIGMLVLAASARGRLLLLTTVASLVPFSITWRVDPNFRFTEHVYPALLIAAAVAVDGGVRLLYALLVPRQARERAASRRAGWLPWAAIVGAGVVAVWFVARVSPALVFTETLRAHESATVTAGKRDTTFFDHGWSEVMGGGNVMMRVATGEGRVSLRLPALDDYAVSLRMDPFPRPLGDASGRLPLVEAFLNGKWLGVLTLKWTPERVGSYDIVLPRALVRRGDNELLLRLRRPAAANASLVQPGLTDGDAVGLWYVRVHPGVPGAGS